MNIAEEIILAEYLKNNYKLSDIQVNSDCNMGIDDKGLYCDETINIKILFNPKPCYINVNIGLNKKD